MDTNKIDNNYMLTTNLSVKQVAIIINQFVDKYNDNKSYQPIFTHYNLAIPLALLIEKGWVNVSTFDGAMVLGSLWDYLCDNVFYCDPEANYKSIDDLVKHTLV